MYVYLSLSLSLCSVRAPLSAVEVAKLESCKECRRLTAALARPLELEKGGGGLGLVAPE